MNPYIIGDVGCNWKRNESQDLNLQNALMHIAEAKIKGLSAVKFQLFTHKELYGFDGDNEYCLPEEWLPILSAKAKEVGIDFMCTAFSIDGYKKVDPYVGMHKIASSENNWHELIKFVDSLGKPVLISAGCSSSKDIEDVITSGACKNPVILDCAVSYPASLSGYHLGWLKDLSAKFKINIGLSDHVPSEELACAAVGSGCEYFEIHFDALSRWQNHEGQPVFNRTPDTAVSLNSNSLSSYVSSINRAYIVMDSLKIIDALHEFDASRMHKRRLVATEEIKQGEEIGNKIGVYRVKAYSDLVDPNSFKPSMKASRLINQWEVITHNDVT